MSSILLNVNIGQTVDYQIMYSDSNRNHTIDNDFYIDPKERVIVNEFKTIGIGENGMFIAIVKDSNENTLLISNESIHFEYLSKNINYESYVQKLKSLHYMFSFTIIISNGYNVYKVKYDSSKGYKIKDLSSNLYYFSYKKINKSKSNIWSLRKVWSAMINKIEGSSNKSKKIIEIINNKIFDEKNNSYNVIVKNNSNNIESCFYSLYKMEKKIIKEFIITNVIREYSNYLMNKSKPMTKGLVSPPICAFNVYAKYSREEIIKKYYTGDLKDKSSINKTIGKLWNNMSACKKQKYEEFSYLDKIRYYFENQLYIDEYPDLSEMQLPLGYKEFLKKKNNESLNENRNSNKRKIDNDICQNNPAKKAKVNEFKSQTEITELSSSNVISKEFKVKSEYICYNCVKSIAEENTIKLSSKTEDDFPYFEFIIDDNDSFARQVTLLSDEEDEIFSDLLPIPDNSNNKSLFYSYLYSCEHFNYFNY